jgi:hypothetical protein
MPDDTISFPVPGYRTCVRVSRMSFGYKVI